MEPFDAPIPGQSLTGGPREKPYERPPEISDPEEAVQMHLTRLTEEDRTTALLDALETGLDVKTLTTGLVRTAVAEGIHSIDVGLIVAPVIHEFIKTTADKAGIDYDEGLTDEEEEEQDRKAITAAKAIHKYKKQKPQRANPPREEMPEETVPMDSEGPGSAAGFMRRRNTEVKE